MSGTGREQEQRTAGGMLSKDSKHRALVFAREVEEAVPGNQPPESTNFRFVRADQAGGATYRSFERCTCRLRTIRATPASRLSATLPVKPDAPDAFPRKRPAHCFPPSLVPAPSAGHRP